MQTNLIYELIQYNIIKCYIRINPFHFFKYAKYIENVCITRYFFQCTTQTNASISINVKKKKPKRLNVKELNVEGPWGPY